MSTETSHWEQRPAVESGVSTRRSGSIALVVALAVVIVACAAAFMLMGRSQAQPFILALLAILAMVGLFALFAFAAGILRFADGKTADPVTRAVADNAF